MVTHAASGGSGTGKVHQDPAGALAFAQASGVRFQSDPPTAFDLGIDAVFGIGLNRPPMGQPAEWIARLRVAEAPVLNVDIPSGLNAMTGALLAAPDNGAPAPDAAAGPRYTLTFLTLKPGLFTHFGRDLAGQIWIDDLGLKPNENSRPTAWLHAEPSHSIDYSARTHASHKGLFGEVLVVGGQDIAHNGEGMTGAALLAARAALHAGCGRVYVSLLGSQPQQDRLRYDPGAPELMFRSLEAMRNSSLLDRAVVVCGCGGGSVVEQVLPDLLKRAPKLVLDADALNAISRNTNLQLLLLERSGREAITVLTPHPLEAARLLGSTTQAIMNDRLTSASELARRFRCLVVLKGSGSVVAGPALTPQINASGNGLLATAGTGDVLAGMVGAALGLTAATSLPEAMPAVCSAVYRHGWLADRWAEKRSADANAHHQPALTASRLADAIAIWF